MVEKAKTTQLKKLGIGRIIGSIPLFLLAIICIDIYIENFSQTQIALLQTEILNYPEFTAEILEEITIIRRMGIAVLLIGMVSLLFAILLLSNGILRRQK